MFLEVKNPKIKESLRVGTSFGLTSAVITTLGLMVGLYSSTGSKIVVIGGILTIAIADAFSDSLGVHISEESENKHSSQEIWLSTVFTFLAKFIFALSFLIPVLLLSIKLSVLVSIIWGLSLLTLFSWKMAKDQGEKPHKIIAEHIFIAGLVIVITNFVGSLISRFF